MAGAKGLTAPKVPKTTFPFLKLIPALLGFPGTDQEVVTSNLPVTLPLPRALKPGYHEESRLFDKSLEA